MILNLTFEQSRIVLSTLAHKRQVFKVFRMNPDNTVQDKQYYTTRIAEIDVLIAYIKTTLEQLVEENEQREKSEAERN